MAAAATCILSLTDGKWTDQVSIPHLPPQFPADAPSSSSTVIESEQA